MLNSNDALAFTIPMAQVSRENQTKLEALNQQLRERDSLLNCVNLAAQCLVAKTNLEIALPEVLEILGEGTRQCRAYILKVVCDEASGQQQFHLMFEWDAPHIPNKLETGGQFPVPVDAFPERLTAPLRAGRVTQFLARELDSISVEDRADGKALSLVGVPISISGEWWGLLGLDDCLKERVWSDAEIAVLETAATAVGNALEREQVRQSRELAERKALIERDRAAGERARMLSSVAEAANLLLKSTDYVAVLPEVVRLLGESVACDRCSITRITQPENDLQNHLESGPIRNESSFLTLKLLQEWCKPEVTNSPPELFQAVTISLTDDCPQFRCQILKGEVASLSLPELSELEAAYLEARGSTSMLVVPIMLQNNCWGEISFDDCGGPRVYEDSEIAILRVAAESIAAAVSREDQDTALRQAETAVLEEREKAARDRATELAKLNETIGRSLSALTATPELDDFLGQLLMQMNEQIGACKAHLFLYDDPTDTLSQYIAAQTDPDQSGEWYRKNAPSDPPMFYQPVPTKLSPAWERIIHASRPFTLDERPAEASEMYWPESVVWHQREGHVASTYACMKVGKKPIGFIGFAFRHCPTLSGKQIEFVQALTNQATLAIHLTRLAEQSQNAALTDERNRLAREIHDTLAQSFTGISLQLEASKGMLRKLPTASTVPENPAVNDLLTCLNRASRLAREGLSEARRSVRALRAQVLETNTLPQAIQIALQEITVESTLKTQFRILGDPYALPEDLQTNLLRICQEAIANTLRHAKAAHFSLTLRFEACHVGIHITDDGQGCQITSLAEVEGFGLIGMRERVLRFSGQFSFDSSPGAGTVIGIVVPTQSV